MRTRLVMLLLCIIIPLLFIAGLFIGSVQIAPADVLAALADNGTTDEIIRIIVLETRLPAVATAALAGLALAVAGLLMQTAFSNPLAGPSIMGISSGASLGVALVLLAFPAALGLWGRLATIGSAFLGAMAVMAILALFSSLVRSTTILLIVGILIGYLASSAISLLNFFASSESVHSYVLWGLGSFNSISLGDLPWLASLCVGLTLLTALLAKPLDALLLGERYAANVGVDIARVRSILLILSGALTAAVTAWCGPIGFIGLAVPHIARLLTATNVHRRLIPATALCGAATGLICQILSTAPALSRGILPVNAITPLIGVPVIVYVLLRRKKLSYS
ncbi:MAG: iron ABC transporter permease [Muribaculaceae bacterium]|nr:iron ABC transporter permease [Muribaculaceae bacterium]